MVVTRETFLLGKTQISLTTGDWATNSSSSIVITANNTTLLVALSIDSKPKDCDFLPLSVKYQERFYAVGKIPGSFNRREGKTSDLETIISRMVDRSIRPLLPEDFNYEMQVIITVLSYDQDFPNNDILSILGAVAVLKLAGLPLHNTIAASRIAYLDNNFILNPTHHEQKQSLLNMVIAGHDKKIYMLECEAHNLPAEVILGAILFGQKHLLSAIEAIERLSAARINPSHYLIANKDLELFSYVEKNFVQHIRDQEIIDTASHDFSHFMDVISKRIDQQNATQQNKDILLFNIKKMVKECQRITLVNSILDGNPRIDGRTTREIRPIEIQLSVLPNVHGSALFKRGKTQALVITTLASSNSSQTIDDLEKDNSKNRYMLHYNFPAFATGEIGQYVGPKRREIGHGMLAKKATHAVFPYDQYPYVVRIVSEILAADGSTSMATICGASLAMMDAGVPIASHVAGIAMGLVKSGNKIAILTDISQKEDMLGAMDMKVAGTKEGFTALQMDVKEAEGVSPEIIKAVIQQAKEALIELLDKMNAAIERPRSQISDTAPILHTTSIDPSKIRDLIGKGGSVIKGIIEKTGADIDICSETGSVQIFAKNKATLDQVLDNIATITSDVQINSVYQGKVVKLLPNGAFINIRPKRDGFLPLSPLQNKYGSECKEGLLVTVRVQQIDALGRIKLTLLD